MKKLLLTSALLGAVVLTMTACDDKQVQETKSAVAEAKQDVVDTATQAKDTVVEKATEAKDAVVEKAAEVKDAATEKDRLG